MAIAPKNSLEECETKLASFHPSPDWVHDPYVLICVEEALAAAKDGNFGVGAVLIDGQGEVAQRGHNHVFHPYFRSDLHAEMTVMTTFEDLHPEVKDLKGYALFTSLEPCPMCTARLLMSGISKVYQAAIDVEGGMASRLGQVVPQLGLGWSELTTIEVFFNAQCSPLLKELALDIYLNTAQKNVQALKLRRGL
jgi:tRNA(adenine34) deaminase